MFDLIGDILAVAEIVFGVAILTGGAPALIALTVKYGVNDG